MTQMIECPNCKTIASGPELLTDWNDETYRFTCCGHRAHLDERNGGARNWLTEDAATEPSVSQ